MQALTKLDLENNYIGEQGAEEIADALEINRVFNYSFLRLIGARCISFHIDTFRTCP
jgi:hypothetical protein